MGGQYGVSTCINAGLGRADLFGEIAAAGFRSVELFVDPAGPESWTHDPEAMRRDLEAAGLRAVSLHTPSSGWKNNHPDEEVRRASLEAAAACFGPAGEVGVGVVVVHPTSSDTPLTDEEFAANRRRARESVSELAGRAGKLGLKLAVENLPARGKPRPGARVAELLEMLEGLGEHVGVCLDAGHSNSNGENAAEEARLAGARLLAVHLQDNDGAGEDLHWIPGTGTTDWQALVRALDEAGFSGGRNFEVPAKKGEVAGTLAKLAALAAAWRQL